MTTKANFEQFVKENNGTVQYSGKDSIAYVHGIEEDKFLKKYGRHYKSGFPFQIKFQSSVSREQNKNW